MRFIIWCIDPQSIRYVKGPKQNYLWGAGSFHALTILLSFCSDECADGSHKCDTDMGATCVNEIGNYTCLCPNGYLSDWNKCVGELDALTRAYNEWKWILCFFLV